MNQPVGGIPPPTVRSKLRRLVDDEGDFMKIASIGFLLPVITLGCAIESEDAARGPAEEQVGTAESAVAAPNTIFPNTIFPNTIFPNALHPSAISPGALAPSSLPSAQMGALEADGEAGELSRALMRYLVNCAFDSTQSFTFAWIRDGVWQPETYIGGIGLAPGWETRGLYETEQRWVSACIAARVNYHGATVLVSMRGDHAALSMIEGEVDSYDMQEGAFWGNIFASDPYVTACYDAENVDHSRSKKRDCAAGHLEGTTVSDCGPITRVGPCSGACLDRTVPAGVDDGFASCAGVAEVITVYLTSD